MSSLEVAGVIGGALLTWGAVVTGIWRGGRAVVRNVSAHVRATEANTAAVDALRHAFTDHATATDRAVASLDTRVTVLERLSNVPAS